ncbi:uncharacterized protein LOC127263236 [Andrographis paniculata]|uniref:uncharacterized protein LOC127263236 n=1 Tax=Andrographis paniculata TaxID=175694 RepID=UPI0021E6FF87|nr:uncharacterized protein LOC127263236 [Andrographis paniculata]
MEQTEEGTLGEEKIKERKERKKVKKIGQLDFNFNFINSFIKCLFSQIRHEHKLNTNLGSKPQPVDGQNDKQWLRKASAPCPRRFTPSIMMSFKSATDRAEDVGQIFLADRELDFEKMEIEGGFCIR